MPKRRVHLPLVRGEFMYPGVTAHTFVQSSWVRPDHEEHLPR